MNGEYWTFKPISEATRKEKEDDYKNIIYIIENGKYEEIAKLEVLSNLEVDRAKKDFPEVDIDELKEKLVYENRNTHTVLSHREIDFLCSLIENYCNREGKEIEISKFVQDAKWLEGYDKWKAKIPQNPQVFDLLREQKPYKLLETVELLMLMPTYYDALVGSSDRFTAYKVVRNEEERNIKFNVMLYLAEEIYKKSIEKKEGTDIDDIVSKVIADKIIDFYVLIGLENIINKEEKEIIKKSKAAFIGDIKKTVKEKYKESNSKECTIEDSELEKKIINSFYSVINTDSILKKCVQTYLIPDYKYDEIPHLGITQGDLEFGRLRSYAEYFIMYNISYNTIKEKVENKIKKMGIKNPGNIDYPLIIRNNELSLWKAPVSLDNFEGSFMGRLLTWINGEKKVNNTFFSQNYKDINKLISKEYETYEKNKKEMLEGIIKSLEENNDEEFDVPINNEEIKSMIENRMKNTKQEPHMRIKRQTEDKTFWDYRSGKSKPDGHVNDRVAQAKKVMNLLSVEENINLHDTQIRSAFNIIKKNIDNIIDTNDGSKEDLYKQILAQYEQYCDNIKNNVDDKTKIILFKMVLYSYAPF